MAIANLIDATQQLEQLLTQRILVLDGAMGTMVHALELTEEQWRGERFAAHPKNLRNCIDILCLTQPAAIEQIHRQYLEAGADIIDLNFGCPCKEVTGALSGSALMREPELAARIIGAAVDATSRPVTLKMRLGWDEQSRNAPELAAKAQSLGVKAITVHARTRKQFYTGAADWDAVAEVRKAITLPLIVNGDIVDAASARDALRRSGADAVMLGRGSYGRPWAMAAIDRALNGGDETEPVLGHRLEVALQHFSDTLKFYGDALGLKIFRKHLGWYVEKAFMPADPAERRAAKARLCQIDSARTVEMSLTALWSDSALPMSAGVTM